MKKLSLCICACLLAMTSIGQKKNEKFQYFIKKATSDIKIDGVIDEAAWKDMQVATDFFMVLPMDTSKAALRTEVRMAYNDKYIFISAVNYQSHRMVVESLRRDWNFNKNDNFIFFLDPFDDQVNGFTFGANAAGAEWDAQLFDGGPANLSWDNRWYSNVKQYPDRWVFEAAIPFKTIRYKKGITRWGVNFSRNDLTTTEKSVWGPVPRQFPTSTLAFTGVLLWDTPPPEAGMNVSLIPYALGSTVKDFEKNTPASNRGDVGMDAKVSLTSSLNLDLTVNPDFSQVEVDRQQTNLDRFELFFPERRQFFLENTDLFNNLGLSSIRPFFSRRIGLGVPIRYGARISGRLDKNWRIGLMDMKTGEQATTGLPAQNFVVATVQRRVASRSNITGFFINKDAIDYTPDPTKTQYSSYNRNMGLEYNMASQNNVWRGKAMYFKSFSPAIKNDDAAWAGNIKYSDRRWTWDFQHEYVGKNYNPEVGYTPRRGYHKSTVNAAVNVFPKGTKVLSYTYGVFGFNFFNADGFGNTIENEQALIGTVTFRNRMSFTAWVGHNYTKLLGDFDPTNFTGIRIPANTNHLWKSWGTIFESKPQGLFTYGFETRYGGYFAEGTRFRGLGYGAYRFQPYASIALQAEYNNIRFPQNNKYQLQNAAFWLVSPRIDVTFTKKIYLTTFIQYNEQSNNVNLNTRFQWRYSPASDLFLVYTDNYFPDTFLTRNRALVLKFTYWWNV